MKRRRALLYMPGDDRHKIEKAITLGVDCICMDLEDGVALNRKQEARRNVVEALDRLDFGRAEKLVRVNPARSGLLEQDLAAILPAGPDGLVLPKVEDAQVLQYLDERMGELEKHKGLRQGTLALIAIAESAKAIVNLEEICSACSRLQAVIFGGEDLAVELGAERTREAWELFVARSSTVLHAAVAGIQAIDMVNTDFKDLEWIRKEAKTGAQMGFAGKQVIHPAQVQPVQEAFTPSQDEVRSARQLIDAFEENQRNGRGAFAMDGRMVDMPVVKRARNVLERAGLL
jgi:citrate lyase subunit beta-like protein